MAPLRSAPRSGHKRCRAALCAAACSAVLALGLRSAAADFALPRLGRREGLLAAGGLLASPQPAQALSDKYVHLNIDVEDGDGPKTERVTVRLNKNWSPRGVRRFLKMISLGDLDNAAFYHVDGDAAHFGLPAEPTLPMTPIGDDLVQTSNTRGTVAFKPSSYSGRVNELFINYRTNKPLDRAGVSPIGEVVGDGMEVIDRLYNGYGTLPSKYDIKQSGNKYLDTEFPKLAKIRGVSVEEVDGDAEA